MGGRFMGVEVWLVVNFGGGCLGGCGDGGGIAD